MIHLRQILPLVIVLHALSACGGASSRNASVWDNYDIRHPVPANSAVPVSRATVYDRYTDNDAFYSQPAFGSCTAADLASFTCD